MVIDIKAGIKTTEFWVTLLAIVIVAGAKLANIELDVAAVAGITTSAVAYVAARAAAKKAV